MVTKCENNCFLVGANSNLRSFFANDDTLIVAITEK